jgi:energy-coupling factor transporter ATP-binding protein EcfA2
MQNFVVNLKSESPKGFRSVKAAQSVDLPIDQKLVHYFEIKADVQTDFNVGLIIGASGSGKTTLTHEMFGPDCFANMLDLSKPIIEQFPSSMSYDDCVNTLTGIGLSQVPCWVKPAGALSNGQKARAEAALQMSSNRPIVCIDEFTSVVDRNVAKAMAHCVQKFARKYNKKIVLVSCHYDVFEWLNPDWVIDCNRSTYDDRRFLCRSFERKEKLKFEIAKCKRDTWRNFSKYHYLSDNLPGGHIETFGVYLDGRQIGFQCFANYVPHRKGTKKIMHSNRTVIHPDYVGFGLGIKIIDITSEKMFLDGYTVMAKFSSIPVFKAMSKNKKWTLNEISNNTQSSQFKPSGNMSRQTGLRQKTKTFSFLYVG